MKLDIEGEKKRWIDRRFVPSLSIAAFLFLCGYGLQDTIQRFTGMTGATRKNGIGCYCHSPVPSPSVSVWVEGPDSLASGQEGLYTLFVAKDSSLTAGFNVATDFGVLDVVDTLEAYWYEDELTHTEPKAANGSDTISWQFRYFAPDLSFRIRDTIYSVGNSTNQDTLPNEGDLWNYGEDFVVHVGGRTTGVGPEAETPAAFRLGQNFPNPFNPRTRIRFELPEASSVRIGIYDVTGRLVREIGNGEYPAGTHDVTFRASGPEISSGLYFYHFSGVEIGGSKVFTGTGKMLLLK